MKNSAEEVELDKSRVCEGYEGAVALRQMDDSAAVETDVKILRA